VEGVEECFLHSSLQLYIRGGKYMSLVCGNRDFKFYIIIKESILIYVYETMPNEVFIIFVPSEALK
jgi:hypothetical protein